MVSVCQSTFSQKTLGDMVNILGTFNGGLGSTELMVGLDLRGHFQPK